MSNKNRGGIRLERQALKRQLRARAGWRAGLLSGAAVLSVAVGASSAQAACVADPADALKTICAGVATDVSIALGDQDYGRTILVDKTADLTSSGGNAALAISVDNGNAGYVTLRVDGSARGNDGIGATLDSVGGNIVIGRTGVLSGDVGLQITDVNNYGTSGWLRNAGLISGSGGFAITTGTVDSSQQWFESVANSFRGEINGSIMTPVGQLYNAGVMTAAEGQPAAFALYDVTNVGSIQGALGVGGALVNKGVISGGAIDPLSGITTPAAVVLIGYMDHDLTNAAGATISADGQAIARAEGDAGRVRLVNAGTINGAVDFGAVEMADQIVQQVGGTIDGAVSLGGGDDIFLAEHNGQGAVRTGVAGTLDGGEGLDSFGVRMIGSGTVSLDALPTGFEIHAVDLADSLPDVTVAADATVADMVQLTGQGKVTLTADISTANAPALAAYSTSNLGNYPETGLSVVNKGTITAAITRDGDGNLPPVAAAGTLEYYGYWGYANYTAGALFGFKPVNSLSDYDGDLRSFVNDGTITVNGDFDLGVAVKAGDYYDDSDTAVGFVNNGTITGNIHSTSTGVAGGFGVLLGSYMSAANNGTIDFTAGDGRGVLLDNAGLVNTGAILASDVAIRGTGFIDNSGTISSINGPAIVQGFGDDNVNYYDMLTIANRAGGEIIGSILGQDNRNLSVINQGRIDGDIIGGGNYASTILYLADGSRIAGDVTLQTGNNLIITDLDQSDPSALIDGTLSIDPNGYNRIRFRSTRNQSAEIVTEVAGFYTVGYEAAADTTLTLTSQAPVTGALTLTGKGTIDVDADFTLGSGGLLQVSSESVEDYAQRYYDGEKGVSVVSNGLIAATLGYDFYSYNDGIVRIDSNYGAASFENAGSISLSADATISYSASTGRSYMAAIMGGYDATVKNSGSIVIGGENLVGDAGTSLVGISAQQGIVTNSGSITSQGTRLSTGVALANSLLTNEAGATIRTSGPAVAANYGYIVNSGTIESTEGAAIAGRTNVIDYYSSYADGYSGGSFGLVNRAGGIVTGAGIAIQGFDTQAYWGINIYDNYVDNAGTINGDVNFASGDDLLILRDGGVINGSVSLGDGDNTVLVEGNGPGITGTFDASGNGIDAYGRLYTASATANLTKPAGFEAYAVGLSGGSTALALTADGDLAGQVRIYGHEGTIENRTNIVTTGTEGVTVSDIPTGWEEDRPEPALAFVNKGSVQVTDATGIRAGDGQLISFANEGAITADYTGVDFYSGNLTGGFAFSNVATITSNYDTGVSFSVDVGADEDYDYALMAGGPDREEYLPVGAVNSFTNSGTIQGGQGVSIGVEGGALAFANSGTITGVDNGAGIETVTADINNSGGIVATGQYAGALQMRVYGTGLAGKTADGQTVYSQSVVAKIVNSGSISANGDGNLYDDYLQASNAVGISLAGGGGVAQLVNQTGGVIEAKGNGGIAVAVIGSTGEEPRMAVKDSGRSTGSGNNGFLLVNQGTIEGGSSIAVRDGMNVDVGSEYVYLDARLQDQAVGTAIQTAYTTDTIRNETGGVIIGDINLADGDDTIENYGRITGNVYLGDGNDIFVQATSGLLEGNVDGGLGTNRLVFELTGDATVDFSDARFTNFQLFEQRGGNGAVAGHVDADTYNLVGTTFTLGAGRTFSTNGSVALTGSDGSETVDNSGTIYGDVALGGGNDRFILHPGSSVVGTVDGGADTDTLDIQTTDSNTRYLFNGSGYTGFEVLQLSQSGTVALTGSNAFPSVLVSNGYLVGLAGSTLTGNVFVASGATFGSAGRVVGNVSVAGTLSPGASPATMTVAGNVALASGSNTLFELTPTISDQLLISGTLSIENGATLTLTGERPLTPGQSYQLVQADGGISGRFSTVLQPSTIQGFITYDADSIDLRGEFGIEPGFTPQVVASINYMNRVLLAGQGPAALYGSLSNLITAQGGTSAAAFAQLTPEPYASATEIGVEHALTLIDTTRTRFQTAGQGQKGVYGFAQGIGNWRDLDGHRSAGAVSADISSRGLVGGFGYSNEQGADAGLFVGYLDSTQRLKGLGARTEADGIVGGGFANGMFGNFGLHAMVAYDGSSARTTRTVAAGDGVARSSKYDLGGWSFDLSADYAARISDNWSLVPHAGVSHVRVKRDGTAETGAGAFALTVDGETDKLWFADAGLAVSGAFTLPSGMQMTPYAQLGMRRVLEDGDITATARFSNASVAPLTVVGAGRSRTTVTMGGGLGATLTSGVRLFGGYTAEFGNDGNRMGVNGGVSVRF